MFVVVELSCRGMDTFIVESGGKLKDTKGYYKAIFDVFSGGSGTFNAPLGIRQ